MSGVIEEANKTAAGIRFELENSDGVEGTNLIQIASFNRRGESARESDRTASDRKKKTNKEMKSRRRKREKRINLISNKSH